MPLSRENLPQLSIPATPVCVGRSDSEPPIVVDLDRTLIRTDLLVESFLVLLASRPKAAFTVLIAIRNGKVALTTKLVEAAILDIAAHPLNQQVLAFLNAETVKGRLVYLASAFNRSYVALVADHLGNHLLGSNASIQLAGPVEADRLCKAFGERGFDYIGDRSTDEAIWQLSLCAYIANALPADLATLRTSAPHAQALGMRASLWRDYVLALRPHQWLKNILVFAPVLAAHRSGHALLASFLAFISFCFCASSVYIMNDLLDLRNDRAHPRKQLRPFAAARIPVMHGVALCPLLLIGSLAVAAFLPMQFVLVLVTYFILTCAYSLDLKRRLVVDVVALACLYGSRLAAGSAAAEVPLSHWLAVFAIFLFFSLALVKRMGELTDHLERGTGDPTGRGYRLDDLSVLQSMATASGYVSVLVLALYINGDVVGALYRHPDRLWFNFVLLLFWISRMILVTHRGQMHEDPLVFAATDRTSQLIMLACVITTISAIV
jgi:4-hydroxybenzoate polyprenyltransferase